MKNRFVINTAKMVMSKGWKRRFRQLAVIQAKH